MSVKAHSPAPERPSLWHYLSDHAKGMFLILQPKAKRLGLEVCLLVLCYLHDMGKASDAWQDYLQRSHRGLKPDTVPHTDVGTLLLYRWANSKGGLGLGGKLLALSVWGHHGGLKDLIDVDGFASPDADLQSRFPSAYAWFVAEVAPILNPLLPALRKELDTIASESKSPRDLLPFHLRLRMLHSMLKDVDCLDTERFYLDHLRNSQGPVQSHLQTHLQALAKRRSAFPMNRMSPVREKVYRDAVSQAAKDSGWFLLEAPTGTGKTLASLGFALEHARASQKERIIFVLPYLSLVEQTVRELKATLGEGVLIEHHSNTPKRSKDVSNWDAPIIVTTTVQFYETLFASRCSRLRKLHNVVDSLVVIDEAQVLDARLLDHTFRSLDLLVEEYGASILLSTATPILPDYIREKARALYSGGVDLSRRAEVYIDEEPLKTSDLAHNLMRETQVLCVLNTHKEALEVASLFDPSEVFYISSRLCPKDRIRILSQVRECLSRGYECRVISTPIIEVGVDLDFNTCYRQFSTWDRLLQALGRVNRHYSDDLGTMIIFDLQGEGSEDPEHGDVPIDGVSPLLGAYHAAIAWTKLHLKDPMDLFDPECYKRFCEYYWGLGENESSFIDEPIKEQSFETISKEYRLIPDTTKSYVIRDHPNPIYRDQIDRLICELRNNPGKSKRLLRELSLFSVSLPPWVQVEGQYDEWQWMPPKTPEDTARTLLFWTGTYEPDFRGLLV